ncbi:Txe/YoeB family addiction module toxin [Roseivirga sp. BDSF3-8]|uniref:Txe/YoeB family addiction module toxin n=1 Tax=Roseivirga sp. BDSF3-8 TaxID=3241598 RepID=UPI0035319A17
MKTYWTRESKPGLEKLLQENRKLGAKVLELLLDIDKYSDSPLQGKGKPERLRGNPSEFYSRRITEKHRLIYSYLAEGICIISCYGHYDDR